jgi:tetratricopeptide (TPR) repeat protein
MLAAIGFFFVCVLAAFAVQWLRSLDHGVRRAEKRAREGDLAGAISDLREQIEELGPTALRVNTLGILLLRAELCDEAAAMFRKPEQIGGLNKGLCRANLGLALLKSGKPEAAIPVLQEAERTSPRIPAPVCVVSLNTALALVELNRLDEAYEQLRRAEETARRLRKTQRSALKDEFERCRQKIDEAHQRRLTID